MNLIKTLEARIVGDRTAKAFPCKTYKTEVAAEKATNEAARNYALGLAPLALSDDQVKSAEYVVFYVEAFDRWVGCINAGEVLRRPGFGGYVAAEMGFYKY